MYQPRSALSPRAGLRIGPDSDVCDRNLQQKKSPKLEKEDGERTPRGNVACTGAQNRNRILPHSRTASPIERNKKKIKQNKKEAAQHAQCIVSVTGYKCVYCIRRQYK